MKDYSKLNKNASKLEKKAPNKVSGPSGGKGPKTLTGQMNEKMY